MSMPPAGPPPGYQGPQGPQSNQGNPGYGEPTVAMSRPNQPYGPQQPQSQPQQSQPQQSQPQQSQPQQSQPQQSQPQQQPQQQPPAAPRQKGSSVVLLLGLVALVGVVLGLSIDEGGHNAWESVNAWGGVAIVGALATLAPALGRSIGLTGQRAWQVAVCGAGALVLFWVLFTLPTVGSNTSLLTTIGVAAGLIAAWLAPGRADQPADAAHRW